MEITDIISFEIIAIVISAIVVITSFCIICGDCRRRYTSDWIVLAIRTATVMAVIAGALYLMYAQLVLKAF